MVSEARRPFLQWSDRPLHQHQGEQASVYQIRFVCNSSKKSINYACPLACRQFDEAHTGLAIADKMMEILKENGIEDKTFFCITDSASNMIKGNLSDIEA